MHVLNGEPLSPGQPFVVGEVQYPGNVLSLWKPDELAAIGVTWVEPPAPPEPEPVRRTIPKSVVQERMNDIGKLGAAFAALNSNPIYFGRWFAPDWPNVYADDEGLLQVLAAIGCTEAEVAGVTASLGPAPG